MPRNRISLTLAVISIIALTMIPTSIEAVPPNYTQVAITAVVKDDDSTLREVRYSPLYHDLYINQGGGLVTFSNSNSFTDTRTNVGQRKLEITTTAGGNEAPCAGTIYTPPFNLECEGFIEVYVPYDGRGEHHYMVMDHYRVYKFTTHWVEEIYVALGKNATVLEIEESQQ